MALTPPERVGGRALSDCNPPWEGAGAGAGRSKSAPLVACPAWELTEGASAKAGPSAGAGAGWKTGAPAVSAGAPLGATRGAAPGAALPSSGPENAVVKGLVMARRGV